MDNLKYCMLQKEHQDHVVVKYDKKISWTYFRRAEALDVMPFHMRHTHLLHRDTNFKTVKESCYQDEFWRM